MADIFLSYARAERSKAEPIRAALTDLGLDVFFDVDGLDGGDVFPDVLDREVKTAGAVVSLWSQHALTRPWIKIESRIGKDRGVLIPVEIGPIDPLHDLPAAFYDDQRISLIDFNGDTSDPGWIKLVRSLARTLGRPDIVEYEARGAAKSAAEEAQLRAELDDLRAQMGDLAAAKAAADKQDAARRQAFKLIENSLSRKDYRDFLERFPNGAAAFEASRRLRHLEEWHAVDKASAADIQAWLEESGRDTFPPLAVQARRALKQARKTEDGSNNGRLLSIGLVAAAMAIGVFALVDPFNLISINSAPPPQALIAPERAPAENDDERVRGAENATVPEGSAEEPAPETSKAELPEPAPVAVPPVSDVVRRDEESGSSSNAATLDRMPTESTIAWRRIGEGLLSTGCRDDPEDFHDCLITTVAWAPDGRHVAVGGYDRTVNIWEIKSGRKVGQYETLALVDSIAFHPTRPIIALSAQEGTRRLVVFNYETGETLVRRNDFDTFHTLAFSEDGSELFGASYEGANVFFTGNRYQNSKPIKRENAQRMSTRTSLRYKDTQFIYNYDYSTDTFLVQSLVAGRIDQTWSLNVGARDIAWARRRPWVVAVIDENRFLVVGPETVSACHFTEGCTALAPRGTGKDAAKIFYLPGETRAVLRDRSGAYSLLAVDGSERTLGLTGIGGAPVSLRLLADGSDRLVEVNANGAAVRRFNRAGAVSSVSTSPAATSANDYYISNISPGGRFALSIYRSGEIQLWSLEP